MSTTMRLPLILCILLAATPALRANSVSNAVPNFKSLGITQDKIRGLIEEADSVRIAFYDRDGSLSLGDGQVSHVTKPISGYYTVPIEDPKFRTKLLPLLKPMELNQSAYCFCSGQPCLEFLKKGIVIFSLMVKHDKVVLVGFEHFRTYVTGYEGLTEAYYAMLGPLIPKHDKRVHEYNVAARCKSRFDEATETLKKDVKQAEQELQDSFKNQPIEVEPPRIEIPSRK